MKPGDLVRVIKLANLENFWDKSGIVLDIFGPLRGYPVIILLDGEALHFNVKELEIIDETW